jgi:hypothetical protein
LRAAPVTVQGHQRGNADHVLSREPDYVILGPAMGTYVDRPWFIGDIQFARNEQFRACYAERTWPMPESMKSQPGTLDVIVFYQRICAKRRI